MAATKIANALEKVKPFADLIPEPVVRAAVKAALELSIGICRCVDRAGKHSKDIVSLAEQQAAISAGVVHELRGLNEAEIKSGRWNNKLADLSKLLVEINTFVLKNTVDGRNDSAAKKAKKMVAKAWNSLDEQTEIKAFRDKLDNVRRMLEMKIAIATSIDAQRILEIVQEMKSATATSGDVQSITDMVQELKKTIATSVEIQRIAEIVRGFVDFYQKTLLDRLQPVLSGRYGAHGSPRDCLPNTRVTLREEVRWRLTADTERRVVWLSGLAGTGKSTVARSICSELKATQYLVSFFIKRDDTERSSQLRILHTLVYQLAQSLPQVLSAVIGAKDELFTERLHKQVMTLVVAPLSTALPDTQPVVIVLDAADERDTAVAPECDLIPCFADAIATAAAPVRMLITSRGQPSDFLRPTYGRVHDTERLQREAVTAVSIHEDRFDAQGDIRAYLVAEFERIATERRKDWRPSQRQIDLLVQRSAGLFIYAATVIRWVDCSTPGAVLSKLLDNASTLMGDNRPDTIFALYDYVIGHALDTTPANTLILRSVLSKGDDRSEPDALGREAVLSILGTQLCLREQLPRKAFTRLWAGHLIADPQEYEGAVDIADDIISRLSGVLFVWERDSLLELLHASFGDFLDAFDSRYCIPRDDFHFQLSSRCVIIICSTKEDYVELHGYQSLSGPRFGRFGALAWIPASDLAARYAFSHWVSHARSATSEQVQHLLKDLRLSERNFWFEGLFNSNPMTRISAASLRDVFEGLRACTGGLEAAYALAGVGYTYADEMLAVTGPDPVPRREELNMLGQALALIASPTADNNVFDVDIERVEQKIEVLDKILTHIVDTRSRNTYVIGLRRSGRGIRDLWELLSWLNRDAQSLDVGDNNTARVGIDFPWPSDFRATFVNFLADLERFQKDFLSEDAESDTDAPVMKLTTWVPKRSKREQRTWPTAAAVFGKYEDKFRYATRVAAHQIVQRYDAIVNSLPATHSPHHSDESTLESNKSRLSDVQSTTREEPRPVSQGVDRSSPKGLHTFEGQSSPVYDPRPPSRDGRVSEVGMNTISPFATRIPNPDQLTRESNETCLPSVQSSTGEEPRPGPYEVHSSQDAASAPSSWPGAVDPNSAEGPHTVEGLGQYDPRPQAGRVSAVAVKIKAAAIVSLFTSLVLLYMLMSSPLA